MRFSIYFIARNLNKSVFKIQFDRGKQQGFPHMGRVFVLMGSKLFENGLTIFVKLVNLQTLTVWGSTSHMNKCENKKGVLIS